MGEPTNIGFSRSAPGRQKINMPPYWLTAADLQCPHLPNLVLQPNRFCGSVRRRPTTRRLPGLRPALPQLHRPTIKSVAAHVKPPRQLPSISGRGGAKIPRPAVKPQFLNRRWGTFPRLRQQLPPRHQSTASSGPTFFDRRWSKNFQTGGGFQYQLCLSI